jgi:hypothetical protein
MKQLNDASIDPKQFLKDGFKPFESKNVVPS